MTYKKTPCLSCQARFANCHSTCKDYAEYKCEVTELREKKQQIDGLTSAIIGCSINRAHKRLR